MTQQNGNALFIILIAIGLLGAATAMFTRSSSTTDDTGDYEQMQIKANDVLRYAGSISQGIQNLIIKGCSENQLSFWHDSDGNGLEDGDDTYYNDKAPDDHSCHLFDQRGAGLTYQNIGSFMNVNTTFGTASVGRSVKGIGSDNQADIYLVLAGGGSTKPRMEKFCEAVNRMAGVYDSANDDYFPDTTQMAIIGDGQKFTGNFVSPIISVFDYDSWRNNSLSFCIEHNTTTLMYFYAIMER